MKFSGRALGELDERSIEILTLRYGLDGVDPHTLEGTGEHFDLTRERIRQLEAKALKKLAHPSRCSDLALFLYPDGLAARQKGSEDDSRKSKRSYQKFQTDEPVMKEEAFVPAKCSI